MNQISSKQILHRRQYTLLLCSHLIYETLHVQDYYHSIIFKASNTLFWGPLAILINLLIETNSNYVQWNNNEICRILLICWYTESCSSLQHIEYTLLQRVIQLLTSQTDVSNFFIYSCFNKRNRDPKQISVVVVTVPNFFI